MAGALLASSVAWAQADAGGQISGTFPSGLDCGKLATPKTRLQCQNSQAQRSPHIDVVPPGTPAIPMPGQSNSLNGPYLGSNAGADEGLHSRRTNH